MLISRGGTGSIKPLFWEKLHCSPCSLKWKKLSIYISIFFSTYDTYFSQAPSFQYFKMLNIRFQQAKMHTSPFTIIVTTKPRSVPNLRHAPQSSSGHRSIRGRDRMSNLRPATISRRDAWRGVVAWHWQVGHPRPAAASRALLASHPVPPPSIHHRVTPSQSSTGDTWSWSVADFECRVCPQCPGCSPPLRANFWLPNCFTWSILLRRSNTLSSDD